MNILGERIKQLRKASGLNQSELATAINKQFGLNIDRAMISKWETGFQTPVMNTIVCLAKYFNVSIDYLNGEKDKSKESPTDNSDETLKFALWDGDTKDITPEMIEEIRKFAQYVRDREKNKNP